jgi:nucleoside-diphosphate-sugar epimerase
MNGKKIVVTGGSGKAGRAVVAELVDHGHDVVNVDIAASRDPDAPTLIADLTDRGAAFDALAGADVVVHLAAIPAPNVLGEGETFRVNTLSTYNVFSAAVALGVTKVVWASSETLIGIPFEREAPRYAPIDEAHPRLPEFHYALSKLLGEDMADQFSRWSGVPFVSLRYSNVMEPADYATRFPTWQHDPSLRRWNLWGYVDSRDVAQATRLAVEIEVPGHQTYLVAAADTCMDIPSVDLMRAVYPDVELRGPIEGNRTLLSIAKARGLLGYAPRHSWRDTT